MMIIFLISLCIITVGVVICLFDDMLGLDVILMGLWGMLFSVLCLSIQHVWSLL